MKRFWFNLPLYFTPPGDLGGGDAGGGGSTENSTASGGDSGGVTHGTASDALIAAAEASESSSDTSSTGDEAAAVARATGINVDTPDLAGTAGKGAATTGAKGPQQTGKPSTGAEETGPVPLDRHKAAVTNARTAGFAEAEAKYAWAKGIEQQTVATAFDVVGDLLKDPKAFAVKLAGEVGLQLWDGKTPPAGSAVPAGGASLVGPDGNIKLPKGALRSEDGVEAYSAPQLAEILTGVIATVRQEMTGQLKPILDARSTEESRLRTESIRAAAQETATSALTEARAMPHFQMKDHTGKLIDNPKILVNLQAIPAKVRASIGPIAALYQAYNKFLSEDVFPNIGNTAAAAVRDENKRKAASGSSINPASAAGPSGKKEIKGVSDLARRMEEMAAAAGS